MIIYYLNAKQKKNLLVQKSKEVPRSFRGGQNCQWLRRTRTWKWTIIQCSIEFDIRFNLIRNYRYRKTKRSTGFTSTDLITANFEPETTKLMNEIISFKSVFIGNNSLHLDLEIPITFNLVDYCFFLRNVSPNVSLIQLWLFWCCKRIGSSSKSIRYQRKSILSNGSIGFFFVFFFLKQ